MHTKTTVHCAHRIQNVKNDGTKFTVDLKNRAVSELSKDKLVDLTISNLHVTYELPGDSFFDTRLHTPVYLNSPDIAPHPFHHTPAASSSVLQQAISIPGTMTASHHTVFAKELARSYFLTHPLYTEQQASTVINNYLNLKKVYRATATNAKKLADDRAAAHLTLAHSASSEVTTDLDFMEGGIFSSTAQSNMLYKTKWRPFIGPSGGAHQDVVEGQANTIEITASEPDGTLDFLEGSTLWLHGNWNHSTQEFVNLCLGRITAILDSSDNSLIVTDPQQSAYDTFKAPDSTVKIVLDSDAQQNLGASGNVHELYDGSHWYISPYKDFNHYHTAAMDIEDTSSAKYTAMMSALNNTIQIPEVTYKTDHSTAIGLANVHLLEHKNSSRITYVQHDKRTYKISPPQHQMLNFDLEQVFRPKELWAYNLNCPLNVSFDMTFESC